MTTWQQTRPRQNYRKHPLDDWELAMLHEPEVEIDAHPSGRDLWISLGLIVAVVVVSLYGLWCVVGWVVG